MNTGDLHLFYLGGSSPTGFRTPFGDIINSPDYHTYIIKGGPGTGKSTFMKRICETFADEERELYYCSSDPSSADAVVLKEHKTVFVDGTAPHVFEPEYPGAVQEILNLGDCWDTAKLAENKDNIIDAQKYYSKFHVRCRRYLSAAASILDDTVNIASDALNRDKLSGFIRRFAKKTFTAPSEKTGSIVYKQISAVTPDGYSTLMENGDMIYLLGDPYFAGADAFLRGMADEAAARGLTAEISCCTIHGGTVYEHMRIPELKISFISANGINHIRLEEKRPVNFMRFYRRDMLSAKKSRLKFNARAASELLEEAYSSLRSAKEAHDKLEEFYISAVDFGKVDAVLQKYIAKLKLE
ncbi:MAG: hypothetical protein ACI4JF_06295 [Oscillospiraceae bacterium]